MRIKVLGGGWYGCTIARGLAARGYQVELHDIADHLFAGASGANPARLHLGFHYPRSRLTRAHCQEHQGEFLKVFGHLTRCVPINIYAIAANESMVDFANYVQSLKGEVEFVTVYDPAEHGLQNVEGAVLTGERHVIIEQARKFFEEELRYIVRLKSDQKPHDMDDPEYDWTIDCTFCARDSANVDRYEPCLTVLLRGPTKKAVTIMDGPFPSVYPWNEAEGLCSLTSAKWTPFERVPTYWEAKLFLDKLEPKVALERTGEMIEAMAYFYPGIRRYEIAGWKLGIRAMPKSGADSRLVDIVPISNRTLRVRAGKIDAVLHTEQEIARLIAG